MSPEQLTVIRTEKIAAIVTTRNATFWLVNADGESDTDNGAHYFIEKWDDVNGLLYLVAAPRMRRNHYTARMIINYEIIDEVITIKQ